MKCLCSRNLTCACLSSAVMHMLCDLRWQVRELWASTLAPHNWPCRLSVQMYGLELVTSVITSYLRVRVHVLPLSLITITYQPPSSCSEGLESLSANLLDLSLLGEEPLMGETGFRRATLPTKHKKEWEGPSSTQFIFILHNLVLQSVG